MTIGTLIKELRQKKFPDITQTNFAVEKMEMSATWLNLIEHGHKEPSLDMLKRFAKIFKKPLGLFLLVMAYPDIMKIKVMEVGVGDAKKKYFDWLYHQLLNYKNKPHANKSKGSAHNGKNKGSRQGTRTKGKKHK